MKKSNIVLIGFAGCGKSSIGVKLARLMQMRFVDIDSEIEAVCEMTISGIFEGFGEAYFREQETEMVKKAAEDNGCVIATGGGCVKNEENMEYLSGSGIIVYLKCSADKIYSNIRGDNKRPLLQTSDKYGTITALMIERTPLYERYADITVDIDEVGADEAANRLHKVVTAG